MFISIEDLFDRLSLGCKLRLIALLKADGLLSQVEEG